MVEWTVKKYKQLIKDTQSTLCEDDNLRYVAKDILMTEEGLKEFLKEDMCESDPISKIAYDLA